MIQLNKQGRNVQFILVYSYSEDLWRLYTVKLEYIQTFYTKQECRDTLIGNDIERQTLHVFSW